SGLGHPAGPPLGRSWEKRTSRCIERSCCLATYFARLQGARERKDSAWWMRERALTYDDVRRLAETENASLGIPAVMLSSFLQIAARIGYVLMRGTKLRHRRTTLYSFRLETKVTE